MALKEQVYKALNERSGIQRYVARRYLFNLFQRFGLHITGDHFYEIIPDTRLVARQYSDAPRPLPGIDWQFAACEARSLRLLKAYGPEFKKHSTRFGFREVNSYFRGVDALMLYVTLRELRPERVVEIGQGFSTRLTLAALEQNALETGTRPSFTSVDPHQRFDGANVPANVSLELIQSQLQDVDIKPLMENCGMLFVDSSHVYKFGSDVAFELTTLYPQLPPNTLLHIHDIFSPFDYPRDWMVDAKRFWNEQYALECFLMFNSAFEVFLPVHSLLRQSPAFNQALRSLPLDPEFQFTGSSLYLRTHETSTKAN